MKEFISRQFLATKYSTFNSGISLLFYLETVVKKQSRGVNVV